MAIIKKIKLPNEANARDIGALSSNVIYDGDAGTTTTLNEKIQSIFTAIGNINSFEIALVNVLPTEDIDDHTIYFVPNAQDANVRDEYMYVGNQWEMIGSTTIDLSDYPTYDDITITQGLTTGIPAATITVGATTTTIYSADANSLTSTLDSRYVNVTGDTMTGQLTVPPYNSSPDNAGIRFKDNNYEDIILFGYGGYRDPSYDVSIPRIKVGTGVGANQKVLVGGIASPQLNDDATPKQYVDSQINAVTATIPTITPVAALTTGITIGSIDVSGTTTTFYAPEAVTPPIYSLSMIGATITLLADNVAASTITLPIYDGTVALADAATAG